MIQSILKWTTGACFAYCFFFLGMVPVTMTSCGKFSNVDTIIKPFDSVKYNDSLMSYLEYQPTSPGSTWDYELNTFGLISSYTLVCTNIDSTLPDSKVYRRFDIAGKDSEFHMKKDTFQYWTKIPLSSVNNTMMALKSNAKVGEKWYAGKNGTDTYTGEMMERLTSYKIDNNTYKYVLHIRIYKNEPTGGYFDIYAAAGIGAIYTDGVAKVKLIKADIK